MIRMKGLGGSELSNYSYQVFRDGYICLLLKDRQLIDMGEDCGEGVTIYNITSQFQINCPVQLILRSKPQNYNSVEQKREMQDILAEEKENQR